MPRSNFKTMQRLPLPATKALENLLGKQDATLDASFSFPIVTEDDFAFPSLALFPEEDSAKVSFFQSDDMSLCSKDSSLAFSCSDMSFDSCSWKEVTSLKRCGSDRSSASKGLHRSKRLASELCTLRSDSEEERPSKRRSFSTL